jgi:O-antigen ligase
MEGTFIRKRIRRKGPRKVAPSASPWAGFRKKIRLNTVFALGLWGMLWFGYNTSNAYVREPGFPRNTTELIHGVRAFFPIAAGWIALLVILSRSKKAIGWIMSPLGLFLLYAIIGLISSLVLSIDPIDSSYWGFNYLSIILVLVAVASMDDALPDLSKLLVFNWIVSTLLTFTLLGALPFMGGAAGGGEGDVYSESVVRHSYNGGGEILGMAGARNTGFGRYAAIAALAGLARLRTGSRKTRIIWGGVFVVATYALILSNGRTEVFAFIVSAFLVLYADKSRRVIYMIAGAGVAVLLGLEGFYQAFFDYFTRTGHFDFTFTGRTDTWELGLKLLNQSPWVGLGFQADRIYLPFQQHMHNAFLSALVQSGILGGAAVFLGLIAIGYLITKYFFLHPLKNKSLIPPEVPGVFFFVVVSSIAESTFAYFSAAWLLSAPIVVYVLVLNQQVRQAAAMVAKERVKKLTLGKRQPGNDVTVQQPNAPISIVPQS